jgi:plasmid stabilization system protein ParE
VKRRHQVEFSPEAVTHAQQVERWWRENRPAAPGLLMEELAAAVEKLSIAPSTGAPYPSSLSLPGVRRVLLPRTRYHIYYTVDAAAGLVRIHALWHTARGQGPEL